MNIVLKQEDKNREAPICLNDEAVFNETYRSYYHPLCFYASKIVGGDAEDVIESLFVRLWAKRQLFNDRGHLRAFLYLATRNACLDHVKANKKHNSNEGIYGHEVADADHMHTLIAAETYAEIYRSIHNLPTQCAKVIELGFFEGLSNKEIAKVMGISEQTVKNYKVRGLSLLKNSLSGRVFLLISGFL